MVRNPVLLDQILRKLKPIGLTVGVISFFINLMILPLSIYSLQVMDRVVSTGSMATLFWLTAIMLAVFFVAGILQTLRGLILSRASEWLHEEITEIVLPMVLTQAATGAKGASHMRDAATLKNFLGGNNFTMLLDAPWSLLYIAGLFIIHMSLGVLVTAGAVALLILGWINEVAIRTPIKEAGARQMRSMQELEMATRNAEVTEAMGISAALVARWKIMQKRITELQLHGSDRASVVGGITKFVRLSLQVGVTALSAWLALQGSVTTGAIIAASILASRALAPFEAAIASWKGLSETREAYGRLRETLEAAVQRETPMALPVPEGVISSENVDYTHPEQKHPILQQISFALNAGDILGVIGPSGCGKSTLARLLVGINPPQAGALRLDGADIYRWPREEFGKHVGYLPQDVELFSGTISENISRFRDNPDAEAIVRAAQFAGAHELILRLPQGYDTPIGPGGALLSAGQRQRIGLARALFGEPRLLVLDEPDASLDDIGQQALILALRRARHHRITTIMITHRKSLLSQVDKILYIQNGAVAAFGPAAAVMEAMANAPRAEATA